MIKSLQSLRFVFALMIFFHHYSFNGVALFDAGGTCGVSFFIILSGFVMSIGYKQRVLSPSFSYKEYLKRRFARLYPLHLLCLLCVIVCHGINYTLKDWLALIPSLFLLQSWIPIKGVYFAGNAVSWCLSDLFFFYAVFPFVIQSIAKCSVRTNTLILLTVISLYAFAVVVLPETLYHPMLYISPIFRIIDFIIGVYLYEVFSRIITGEFVSKLNRLSFTFKTAIEAFVCLLLVIAILGYHYSPKCIVYASYYWLIMPFVIITLSLFNISGGGAVSLFLQTRVMIYLGEISFTFYMLHYVGIEVLRIMMGFFSISPTVELALVLISILILSIVINILFERPIAELINNKLWIQK